MLFANDNCCNDGVEHKIDTICGMSSYDKRLYDRLIDRNDVVNRELYAIDNNDWVVKTAWMLSVGGIKRDEIVGIMSSFLLYGVINEVDEGIAGFVVRGVILIVGRVVVGDEGSCGVVMRFSNLFSFEPIVTLGYDIELGVAVFDELPL
jgi:hypothetical protein